MILTPVHPRRLLPLLCMLVVVAPAAWSQPRLSTLADAGIEYRQDAPPSMRLRIGGALVELDLQRHHRIEAELAGHSAPVARGEHRYYRGRVVDRADTWVRLALIDGAWTGALWDGTTLWLLDPARQHAGQARSLGIAADATVVFPLGAVALPGGFDHGGRDPDAPAAALPATYGDLAPAADLLPAGSNRYLRVTLVLDTEFQALYGGNAASVAGAVLNIVDGIYSAQVGVDVSLRHLQALSGNGAMTSSNADALLVAFRNFILGGSVPSAGVAHLLSGKNFDGATVGLAYVGTVCNGSGYNTGINQITFSQAFGGATVAHEIGHNFNAQHDSQGNGCPSSGFIMAAVINTGAPSSQFSSCSLNYFNQYLTAPLTCLNGPPDPIFGNGFQ
jgi:hypothetical protein